MGGKRKKWNRAGKGGGKAANNDEDSEDATQGKAAGRSGRREGKRHRDDVWTQDSDWDLTNESFEAYYKRQRICREEDFPRLLETLRTGLPVAVRINRMRLGSRCFIERLNELHDTCCNDTERECYAPQMLQWYSQRLAWQWPSLERRVIKKDPRHASLKEYLAQRERAGLITRQEVVSMLPPLFLGVEPHHLVLDLCAAPGSKTSQMLEVMHWQQAASGSGMPTGLVLANELQWRRANMLAHQVNRLGSPCMVVVNSDAQYFPDMFSSASIDTGAREVLRFDRILCDVPCSGDGTMRKTPFIWKSWSSKSGIALHIRQLNILQRGLELLKVGGRLVYSTCSLNPLEDEAVVAAALRRHGDALTLVPPPNQLGDELTTGHGLASWVVPNPLKDDAFFEAYDAVPSECREGKNRLLPTMFAPFGEAAKLWEPVRIHCRRLLPHLMDTGGFFVATFEKKANFLPSAKARRVAAAAARAQVATTPGSNDGPPDAEGADTADGAEPVEDPTPSVSSKPSQALRRVSKEYWPIEQGLGAAEWKDLSTFFGFASNVKERLVVRTEGDKNVFLYSEGAAQLLRQETRLPTRMVMCGVLVLQRTGCHHEKASPWRLVQDGVSQLCCLGLKRRLACSRAFLSKLLRERELSLTEIRLACSSGDIVGFEVFSAPDDESIRSPGSLALTILDKGEDVVPFAMSAVLSETALELQGTALELACLLEDLNGQPSIEDILNGSVSVAPLQNDDEDVEDIDTGNEVEEAIDDSR